MPDERDPKDKIGTSSEMRRDGDTEIERNEPYYDDEPAMDEAEADPAKEGDS